MVNKKKLNWILELLRIRINNLLAISLFFCLKQFFNKKNNKENNILFINTGLLGDVVISTVILKNEVQLKNLYSNVYLLFDKKYDELFENFDSKINILFVDLIKYRTNLLYRIDFLNQLRKLNLEKSINISFNRRTIDDEITLLNGSNVCLGFDNAPKTPKLFSNYIDSHYTQILKPFTGNHHLDILRLLEELGVKSPSTETLLGEPEVFSTKLKKLLHSDRKIISIAPFASNQIKNWDIRNYSILIDSLIKYFNFQIVVLGDKNCYEINKSNDNVRLINLAGKTTLAESYSIISKSSLFIGNDSGLFHLAKSKNIPRIGLIGGGAYNIVYPYGSDEKEILFFKKMDCFGCHWKCIYDQAHCLQEISVANVFDSVKLILADEEAGQ